jgi:hypothetical protein
MCSIKTLETVTEKFEISQVRKILDSLEQNDDSFQTAVNQLSIDTTNKLNSLLIAAGIADHEASSQVTAILEKLEVELQTAARNHRQASLNTTYVMSRKYATFVMTLLAGSRAGTERTLPSN